MYRRRRPQRDKILFSFDAFLDVVANVIGIIIRLILVTWVGARSYTASMQMMQDEPAPAPSTAASALPPPRAADDPLHNKLELAKQEIAEARRHMLEKLGKLEGAQHKTQLTRQELDRLAQQNQELGAQQRLVENELKAKGQKLHEASLSVEELRRRGRDLADQLQHVASLPARTKVLRYHTPVSRVVQGDEIFFECRAGKVAFIDLPAFLHEIKGNMQEISDALRKESKVSRVTSPVGAYRMNYVFERDGGLLESANNFRYGLTGWTIEPLVPGRGEPLEAALAPGSEFHRLTGAVDPHQTVVTFWVYPDSFAIFRALRDYLYERGVEIAGRPLPLEAPIAASRNGTKSRGQ